MSDNVKEVSASEADMGKKLAKAGKLAEEQKAARRERVVKGSHLLGALQERIQGKGLATDDKIAYIKVTKSGVKGKAIYIAKKGGRTDLSGFTVEHPAVIQLTAEEAQKKHLGRVRGQLDFDQSDESVLAAYEQALDTLAAAGTK